MKNELSPLVGQYLQASISHNTRRAYGYDLAHFLEWGGRIPASPERVASYLAEHAMKLSYVTLSRRIVAIGRAHAARKLPSPAHSEIVRATLHGIQRTTGSAQRQVSPCLVTQIREMVKGAKGMRALRDKALLLVGFAGAFRRSELVSIQVGDIRFVEEGAVIHLRRGKTDQIGEGRGIPIPYMRGACCPVKAIKNWIAISGIEGGALFRKVDRYERVSDVGLSPQSVALIVKQRARAIGLDESNYSGHSLRAGLVTSAAISGVSSWKIRQQTRQKSDDVMQRYIRVADMFIGHPLKGMW